MEEARDEMLFEEVKKGRPFVRYVDCFYDAMFPSLDDGEVETLKLPDRYKDIKTN
ncbi:MAG: hypothetical protein HYS81_04840 [Candidatus Aenigmatarchaeota archaeon]|nr:MAG: hypothetical protein HYS81_04840 [Candidatus Aenigmarchaeota archaeon]